VSAEILEKLGKMHTDIKLTNERLQNVVGDVHDHELILRGESKTNGLVGDVRNMKTAQTTSNRLWLMMMATGSAVVGWLGLK
jgi:hypothetical protein